MEADHVQACDGPQATRLLKLIRSYVPVNEQESADRAEMIRRLESGEDLAWRTNASAHLTASAWVVSPDHSRVLFAYHDLYDSWAWLGGHADGDYDLARVALREAAEESGLCRESLRLACPQPCSLEILTVDGHEKRGHYVSSHLHLNLTFMIEADPALTLHARAGENSALRWFAPQEALAASREPWFVERIYPKLIARM